MTEYNDGKWHGWSGGECPVDLLATVDHIWLFNDGTGSSFVRDTPAGNVAFLGNEYGQMIAFRVTKPAPPKPREWFVSGGNCLWDTYAEAYNACDRGEKPIHVREVLPD